jgi:hypothetical protein
MDARELSREVSIREKEVYYPAVMYLKTANVLPGRAVVLAAKNHICKAPPTISLE